MPSQFVSVPVKIETKTMGFLYVILVLCLQTAHKVGSKQIHEDLRAAVATNREELIQYFDVDSIESVPEYDITLIRPQRTRRSIDVNHRKHYKLTAFDKDFQLELEPNDEVVSPTLVVMKKRPGNQWTRDLYTPDGKFLQGHVVSDPNSHVAVRELQDAEMTGTFVIEDHFYKIHPINERIKGILSLKGHGHHVITRRSIKDPKSEIFNRAKYPKPVQDKENERHEKEPQVNQRLRRDVAGPKYYIEAMMTMDKVSCDFYGNVTMNFILAVANMVNRLYKDESIGINAAWILTKIILIQGYEEGLDITKQNVDSAVRYLRVFSAWAKLKNTPAGQVEHFDNGVLLSRQLCGLKDCSLGGVAFSGYPCSLSRGFTVNNARGLDAAFYVAHEMAHNFGIPHDSGECAKGYIMSAGQAHGPSAFQWSTCSANDFKTIYRTASCYHNIPPANITLPSLPPGHTFHADQQCKFLYGPQYRLCPVTTSECGILYCAGRGGCFSSIGTPPVDGTPCGNRKWCVSGYCVDVGSSLPPSVDGGWGSWGPYGACSRTCGGGLRHRTRKCDNPRPMYDGKFCPGSAIGEWKICNTQACPSNAMHYRKYQCIVKDPTYVGYHVDSKSPCYLWCKKAGTATGEGNVADGTKYTEDPDMLDICITGKRVPVGCDHVIRSGKIKDRCMKCKGNGSTCVRTVGKYTKLWNKLGGANADPMFVIPANSTNFFIKENGVTWNLLNLKLYPPEKNPLIFYERPLNSSKVVAGTTVFYDVTNSHLNYAESMFFKGPNTVPLVPMFVYVYYNNVGYTYSFYVPGPAPDTEFIWKSVLTGDCSTTCAGGLKAQTVTCHREDDQTRVDEEYCNTTTRPSNHVPCNVQPCPARWDPEPWGLCSRRCGSGIKTRLIPCIQQVKQNKYSEVESRHCNVSIRPQLSEPCNQVACGVSWVVGNWSECFLVNGSLIATRTVRCQNILGNGTVINADPKECTAVDNIIPESVKNCFFTTTSSTTNFTTTSPTKGPGDTEASIGISLPITLGVVFGVFLILIVIILVLFRFGYLPCHHTRASEDLKLHYVGTVEV